MINAFTGTAADGRGYTIQAEDRSILLAGSRHGFLKLTSCTEIIKQLRRQDFRFYVGCSDGIDGCFRRAMKYAPDAKDYFIACAWPTRAEKVGREGLRVAWTVPPSYRSSEDLGNRTIWMIERAASVLLIPEAPKTGLWGPGSKLVYDTALKQAAPVFVAAARPVSAPRGFASIRGNFCDVLGGWWVVSEDRVQWNDKA